METIFQAQGRATVMFHLVRTVGLGWSAHSYIGPYAPLIAGLTTVMYEGTPIRHPDRRHLVALVAHSPDQI